MPIKTTVKLPDEPPMTLAALPKSLWEKYRQYEMRVAMTVEQETPSMIRSDLSKSAVVHRDAEMIVAESEKVGTKLIKEAEEHAFLVDIQKAIGIDEMNRLDPSLVSKYIMSNKHTKGIFNKFSKKFEKSEDIKAERDALGRQLSQEEAALHTFDKAVDDASAVVDKNSLKISYINEKTGFAESKYIMPLEYKVNYKTTPSGHHVLADRPYPHVEKVWNESKGKFEDYEIMVAKGDPVIDSMKRAEARTVYAEEFGKEVVGGIQVRDLVPNEVRINISRNNVGWLNEVRKEQGKGLFYSEDFGGTIWVSKKNLYSKAEDDLQTAIFQRHDARVITKKTALRHQNISNKYKHHMSRITSGDPDAMMTRLLSLNDLMREQGKTPAQRLAAYVAGKKQIDAIVMGGLKKQQKERGWVIDEVTGEKMYAPFGINLNDMKAANVFYKKYSGSPIFEKITPFGNVQLFYQTHFGGVFGKRRYQST